MLESWRDYDNNPHACQIVLNRNPDGSLKYEPVTGIPLERVLHHGRAPRDKYKRRTDEVKTTRHWGQRKLLLCEVEFINMFRDQVKNVVYAGAAPGTHITMLSEMFPDVVFHCVDPAPFMVKPVPGKIVTRQEFFTDELAREYQTLEGLLFVCDVRAADWLRMNRQQVQDQVMADMDAQKRWHEILNPIASELKFRLPWGQGKTSYPDGEIYLPIWGPITTTEARLICRGGALPKDYDNTVYEEELFYFNTRQRCALYPHNYGSDLRPDSQFDHCYDCAAEVHVIEEHLRINQSRLGIDWDGADPESRANMVINMSWDMNAVAASRTLRDENQDPGDRIRKISKRQWIDEKPAYEAVANARCVDVLVSTNSAGVQGITSESIFEGREAVAVVDGTGSDDVGNVEKGGMETEREEGVGNKSRPPSAESLSATPAGAPASAEDDGETDKGSGYMELGMKLLKGKYTGGGLGRNGKGIVEPIESSEQVSTRGIGYSGGANSGYAPSAQRIETGRVPAITTSLESHERSRPGEPSQPQSEQEQQQILLDNDGGPKKRQRVEAQAFVMSRLGEKRPE